MNKSTRARFKFNNYWSIFLNSIITYIRNFQSFNKFYIFDKKLFFCLMDYPQIFFNVISLLIKSFIICIFYKKKFKHIKLTHQQSSNSQKTLLPIIVIQSFFFQIFHFKQVFIIFTIIIQKKFACTPIEKHSRHKKKFKNFKPQKNKKFYVKKTPRGTQAYYTLVWVKVLWSFFVLNIKDIVKKIWICIYNLLNFRNLHLDQCCINSCKTPASTFKSHQTLYKIFVMKFLANNKPHAQMTDHTSVPSQMLQCCVCVISIVLYIIAAAVFCDVTRHQPKHIPQLLPARAVACVLFHCNIYLYIYESRFDPDEAIRKFRQISKFGDFL